MIGIFAFVLHASITLIVTPKNMITFSNRIKAITTRYSFIAIAFTALSSGISVAESDCVTEPTITNEEIKTLISEHSDVALVKAVTDWHAKVDPKSAYTEVRVIHGWGNEPKRIIQFSRIATNCTKPKRLILGSVYAALIVNKKISHFFEYEVVKEFTDLKGRPHYRFLSIKNP